MTSLLKFGAIAASRGEGLHPKLRDLFERDAAFPNSEVMYHDGMLQAGSPPASKNPEQLGDVAGSRIPDASADRWLKPSRFFRFQDKNRSSARGENT